MSTPPQSAVVEALISPRRRLLTGLHGCLRSGPFRNAVLTCEVVQVVGLALHVPRLMAHVLLAVGLSSGVGVGSSDTTMRSGDRVCPAVLWAAADNPNVDTR